MTVRLLATMTRRVLCRLAVLPLLLVACSHLNAAAPLPCDEIKDVQGLKEQILEARNRDKLRGVPETDILRKYALDASAICHGNKKLR